MKAKQVNLTGEERLAIKTLVSMDIRDNIKRKEMGIEPAFDTEMLMNLYYKLAGYEWEED